MAYLDKILQPNETVTAVGKKHWVIYAPGAGVLILAAIIEGLGSAFPGAGLFFQIVAGIVAVVALVLLVREWFDQWTTEIVVTNKRVVYKRGFISRYTSEMNMEKVESVGVDQNLPGRILGYGSVDIRGTGSGMERLTGIAAPLALRNAITVH